MNRMLLARIWATVLVVSLFATFILFGLAANGYIPFWPAMTAGLIMFSLIFVLAMAAIWS